MMENDDFWVEIDAMPMPMTAIDQYFDADELADDIRAPEYLIDGFLEVDVQGILGGPSQTFKSFLAIKLAHSISTGNDFFGHKVCKKGLVVYVCGEGMGGLSRRIKAAKIGYGGFSSNFKIKRVHSPIDNPEKMEDLLDELKELNPLLVIFDTFSSLTERTEENSNSDVARVLHLVSRICREINASSIIVHHTGKDTEKGLRGASAFSSNVDVVWAMKRASGTMQTTLECKKIKDGEPFSPLILEAEKVDIELKDAEGQTLESLILKLAASKEGRRSNKDQALYLLNELYSTPDNSEEPIPWDVWCGELLNNNMADSSTRKAKSALIEEKKIEKVGVNCFKPVTV